jgi:hypothetical protein
MQPPSSGQKNEPGKVPSVKREASRAGFSLGLFFDPEYEGDIFFRNVG